MYQIRKHVGLRESMAHIYNGCYGEFSDLSDAIAWAHFKHDNLNWTYLCLSDGTILYAISPTSDEGTFRDAYKDHVRDNPWLEWSVKQYRIGRVK